MRTRAAVVSALASIAVLATGWELGTAGATESSAAATTAAAAAEQAPSAPTAEPTASAPSPTPSNAPTDAMRTPTPTPTPTASTPTTPSATADGTYTGSAVTTRFGAVQVAVTVAGGEITDVAALQLTDKDNRSVSISNRAAPILRQEVLAAQSADVQAVSGATYTSDAYLTSLQSALDQAGL